MDARKKIIFVKTKEDEKDYQDIGDDDGAGGVRVPEVYDTLPDDFQTTVADKNIQLVDVRTAEEYAEQHIPGAVNIDVYAEDFIGQCKAKLDASRPVAVYCRSGKRSASAAAQLRKAGFKDVLNLDGGILGWLNAGKPTI